MDKFGAGSEQGGKLPGKQHNIPGTGNSPSDSAGVKDGLSMRERMDSNEGGMHVSTDRDPMTGNPLNRVAKNPGTDKASKNGKSFEIC